MKRYIKKTKRIKFVCKPKVIKTKIIFRSGRAAASTTTGFVPGFPTEFPPTRATAHVLERYLRRNMLHSMALRNMMLHNMTLHNIMMTKNLSASRSKIFLNATLMRIFPGKRWFGPKLVNYYYRFYNVLLVQCKSKFEYINFKELQSTLIRINV